MTAKNVKPKRAGKKQEILRTKEGRFPPGVSGNPAGKPKGIRHMSTLLEEAIRKVAADSGTPEDRAIVLKVIELAKKGDMKAIEHIWDRLEGKAPQKIDLTSGDEPIGNVEQIQELTQKVNELYRGTGG